ncbi:MAG TPA: electron transport complex subunit RsxE, partial [Oceanospirillaceae bacterium]|nr:electron transport complex subunit RsxE [Oceanospirillaceae bacterium]
DGLSMGLGFAAVLVLLGAMRELLGQGTLFADMHLLLGPMAQNWTWVIIDDYRGFLFAVLPPGAFVGMGLIIAAKNTYDQYQTNKNLTLQPHIDAGSKRVRVTGTIA